jgi:hypothetical protein
LNNKDAKKQRETMGSTDWTQLARLPKVTAIETVLTLIALERNGAARSVWGGVAGPVFLFFNGYRVGALGGNTYRDYGKSFCIFRLETPRRPCC